MQPFPLRFLRPSLFVYASGLLAAGFLLGACDRHSAEELPESYGHGSSHQKQYDRHEPDSLVGSKHFSDSKGVSPGGEHTAPTPEPAAKAGETPAGQMFPNSQ